jgi:syntaxin 5
MLTFLDSYLFSSTQRQDPMGDGTSGRSDAKGKSRAAPNGDMLAFDLEAAEGGMGGQSGGDAFMQMQLVEQQVCRFLTLSVVFL